MNDLEDRLRETLDRHAYAGAQGDMPEGTVARIRRRQLLTWGGASVVATAVLAGVLGLLSILGTDGATKQVQRPAATGSGGSTSPTGWPVVTFDGTDPAYVAAALKLYDQNPTGLTTSVSVLGSGEVNGRSWLVTGFETDGGGDWGGASGPCGNLFVAPESGGNESSPQFGICLSPQDDLSGDTPTAVPARMQGGISQPIHLTMYFGIVSALVGRIEVQLEDSETWQPALLAGPEGSPERYFVLFPPHGTVGEVVVYGRDGTELSRLPMCASPTTSCVAPGP